MKSFHLGRFPRWHPPTRTKPPLLHSTAIGRITASQLTSLSTSPPPAHPAYPCTDQLVVEKLPLPNQPWIASQVLTGLVGRPSRWHRRSVRSSQRRRRRRRRCNTSCTVAEDHSPHAAALGSTHSPWRSKARVSGVYSYPRAAAGALRGWASTRGDGCSDNAEVNERRLAAVCGAKVVSGLRRCRQACVPTLCSLRCSRVLLAVGGLSSS